jgi:O-methyltransferase involved in polyketide biosynthesis
MASADTSRISPTAHYTGYVWYRNGLSHPALRTRTGWALFQALRPMNAAYRVAGAPTLEAMLLARHRVIDHLLGEAIEGGRVGQVIEIAAGLSPRGLRFASRYRDRGLVYVEGDLPGMRARKQAALASANEPTGDHHLVELDALADDGSQSLAAVAARLLDPAVGTAVITEGLLPYFSPEAVVGMWERFARVLGGFPAGLYLSDLHLEGETMGVRGARVFQALLSAFARGQVHVYFGAETDAEAALTEAGFGRATLHRAGAFADRLGLDRGHGDGLVRVIEAWTRPG